MGLLDRIRKRPLPDDASIRQMLEAGGATAEQAREIVSALGGRLSPGEMQTWLADPNHSHGIPDPDTAGDFGIALDWTPINAIAAGKTQLVIDEARRFAGG